MIKLYRLSLLINVYLAVIIIILSGTLQFLHHLRLQILMQSCKLMYKCMLNFEVMHIVLVIGNPNNREHASKESFAWYQYQVKIVKGDSKECS